MSLELYEYRIFTKFRTQKQSARFHFFIDNVTEIPPFECAREITFNLNVDTLFLTLFAQMVSESAGITDTICRRKIPEHGPASRVHIGGGGLQGTWMSPCDTNFTAANFRWIGSSGESSKNTNRIGPLGQGAINNTGYYVVFEVAAQTFIADAITPRITLSGNTFHMSLLGSDGIHEAASAGFLTWPPARQRNRRWEQ